MTPEELAAELGVSGKSLRAWLRSEVPRSDVEHGQRWELSRETVQAARAKFRSEVIVKREPTALSHGAGNALGSAPLFSRSEALTRPCPVPAEPGVYGWWFRELPLDQDTSTCLTRDGLTLLYVGISPKRPASNGRAPSQQNLRKRVTYHFCGNAEGSTLRKTLGVLLEGRLGTTLRRVGSGNRMTFADREGVLSEWMEQNAYVSYLVDPTPWETEATLIKSLDVPLNLESNAANGFHGTLTALRSAAVRRARELPIVQ